MTAFLKLVTVITPKKSQSITTMTMIKFSTDSMMGLVFLLWKYPIDGKGNKESYGSIFVLYNVMIVPTVTIFLNFLNHIDGNTWPHF